MEKLKIEAGKYYRTNEGSKVLILAKAEGYDYFLGQAMNGWADDGCFLRYDFDGRCPKANSSWNKLVAEWVEPKRIKVFVNIFPSSDVDYPLHTGWQKVKPSQNEEVGGPFSTRLKARQICWKLGGKLKNRVNAATAPESGKRASKVRA